MLADLGMPQAELTVKIFGLAGLVERVFARELPLRQEKAERWFNENLGTRA